MSGPVQGTLPGDVVVADRAEIETLVAEAPGARPGERAFREPWEIRAFALALAAHRTGTYSWPEFQGALIESIGQWEAGADEPGAEPWSYYEHWVTALEAVLARAGRLDVAGLDERTRVVLGTPANRNHHEAHREPVAIDPAVR